jgi:hypothetical protein
MGPTRSQRGPWRSGITELKDTPDDGEQAVDIKVGEGRLSSSALIIPLTVCRSCGTPATTGSAWARCDVAVVDIGPVVDQPNFDNVSWPDPPRRPGRLPACGSAVPGTTMESFGSLTGPVRLGQNVSPAGPSVDHIHGNLPYRAEQIGELKHGRRATSPMDLASWSTRRRRDASSAVWAGPAALGRDRSAGRNRARSCTSSASRVRGSRGSACRTCASIDLTLCRTCDRSKRACGCGSRSAGSDPRRGSGAGRRRCPIQRPDHGPEPQLVRVLGSAA